MSPIRRRNTRPSTITNAKNAPGISISTSSTNENAGEDTCSKMTGIKRSLIKPKESFDEQNIDLPSDQMSTNLSISESIFTMFQPVPLDICENLNNPPPSPPPLMIDTTEEIASQVPKSICDRQSRLNEKNNLSQTPFAKKTTKRLSNNVVHSYSMKDLPINIDEEEILMDDDANINRTPTVSRNRPNAVSRVQDDSIVVSVDRFSQNSNEENFYNRRTSTPLHPSRLQQIDTTARESYNDTFTIDSISSETYEVLSRFPEFRKLVKAYNSEVRTCKVWVNDYARLKRKYEQLEENSFPRPSASALDYLLDLVTRIQQTGGQSDPRADDQLARDLRISPVLLSSLKDSTPQQSALNLFNHIYSGYSSKIKLGSTNNMERLRPGLLDSIFGFAQRSVPGVRYKIQDLKDALNNSIRGARYQMRKTGGDIAALGIFENNNGGGLQRDMNQVVNHENVPDNNHMEIDE